MINVEIKESNKLVLLDTITDKLKNVQLDDVESLIHKELTSRKKYYDLCAPLIGDENIRLQINNRKPYIYSKYANKTTYFVYYNYELDKFVYTSEVNKTTLVGELDFGIGKSGILNKVSKYLKGELSEEDVVKSVAQSLKRKYMNIIKSRESIDYDNSEELVNALLKGELLFQELNAADKTLALNNCKFQSSWPELSRDDIECIKDIYIINGNTSNITLYSYTSHIKNFIKNIETYDSDFSDVISELQEYIASLSDNRLITMFSQMEQSYQNGESLNYLAGFSIDTFSDYVLNSDEYKVFTSHLADYIKKIVDDNPSKYPLENTYENSNLNYLLAVANNDWSLTNILRNFKLDSFGIKGVYVTSREYLYNEAEYIISDVLPVIVSDVRNVFNKFVNGGLIADNIQIMEKVGDYLHNYIDLLAVYEWETSLTQEEIDTKIANAISSYKELDIDNAIRNDNLVFVLN